MTDVPEFLAELLDALIGGPARGYIDREAVLPKYLELLRTQPGITPQQAFEQAYERALQEARKERVA